MTHRSIFSLIALAALSVAAGCGHAAKPSATPHEADYDWSDYKGPGGGADVAKSDATPTASDATSTKGDATSSDDGMPKSAIDSSKSAKGDLAARKTSKGKIHGESVSSVGASALAGASKSALKSKVVSSNVITGPEYEMVQVVFKDASVQIVRPASTPDQAGPKLRSPKVRKDSLSSLESGWYDGDADVLVLVQATKPGKSKKALSALLKSH